MKLLETTIILCIITLLIIVGGLSYTRHEVKTHKLREKEALEQMIEIREERCAVQTALITSRTDQKLVTKGTVKVLLETCRGI